MQGKCNWILTAAVWLLAASAAGMAGAAERGNGAEPAAAAAARGRATRAESYHRYRPAHRHRERRRGGVRRRAVCGATGRSTALATAAASGLLDRRAERRRGRPQLHADRGLGRGVAGRRPGERGLSDAEGVRSQRGAPGAGDGVGARRQQHPRGGIEEPVRRLGVRPRRRRGGDAQLSLGAVRLLRPQGIDSPCPTAGAPGQLCADGPDRGAAMGEAKHRGLRRRPSQRHRFRRVGGRDRPARPDDGGFGARSLRQGHRRVAGSYLGTAGAARRGGGAGR